LIKNKLEPKNKNYKLDSFDISENSSQRPLNNNFSQIRILKDKSQMNLGGIINLSEEKSNEKSLNIVNDLLAICSKSHFICHST